MIRRLNKVRVFIIFVVALAGCRTLPPRENFKSMMNGYVGRVSKSEPSYSPLAEELVTSTSQLTSGNIVKTFTWKSPQGICTYQVEYDQASKVIGWKTVGDDSACILRP